MNAIEHGRPSEDGMVHLRLAPRARRSPARGLGRRRPRSRAQSRPRRNRGRGIAIMTALMDEVELKRDPRGKPASPRQAPPPRRHGRRLTATRIDPSVVELSHERPAADPEHDAAGALGVRSRRVLGQRQDEVARRRVGEVLGTVRPRMIGRQGRRRRRRRACRSRHAHLRSRPAATCRPTAKAPWRLARPAVSAERARTVVPAVRSAPSAKTGQSTTRAPGLLAPVLPADHRTVALTRPLAQRHE